jgi:outer membrane protein assembly factor BamB
MIRAWGACLLILTSTASLRADDWPQWLGPQRDGVWRETGIIQQIPQDGLPIVWRAPVSLGYSGPAVADGRVFVMDYVIHKGEVTNNPGGKDRMEGAERILALDAATGKLLWKYEYDRSYDYSFGGGPRCTPTVEGGRVYSLGAEGDLTCLDAAGGKLLWSKDFQKEYGAHTPTWGVAAHPLVVDDLVYCVVGGEGSVAVAFDKRTGKEVWKALSAKQQGYCPPTLIDYAGRRQLLVWHGESINALDPKTGKTYWTAAVEPRFGMAISEPKLSGTKLLVSGFGQAALLELNAEGTAAEPVWRAEPKNGIFCAISTPHLENGVIYGCDIESGSLMAVRMSDAKRLWQTLVPTTGGERSQRYGNAFPVKQADRYFLFSETGDLILARLTPETYQELGRFHVLEPTNTVFGRKLVWSHPAFAGRRLYARNDKELVCVDLQAKQ